MNICLKRIIIILNNFSELYLCIGMRFAGVQSKAAVVEIIKNFQVSVNKKTQEPLVFDPLQFVLIPIGGIWLDFKPL